MKALDYLLKEILIKVIKIRLFKNNKLKKKQINWIKKLIFTMNLTFSL